MKICLLNENVPIDLKKCIFNENMSIDQIPKSMIGFFVFFFLGGGGVGGISQ